MQVISVSDDLKSFGLFDKVSTAETSINSTKNNPGLTNAERDSVGSIGVQSEPYDMSNEINEITNALAKLDPDVTTMSAGYHATSGPKLFTRLSSFKHTDEQKKTFEIKGFKSF